jgi:hypothetical protein
VLPSARIGKKVLPSKTFFVPEGDCRAPYKSWLAASLGICRGRRPGRQIKARAH